MTTFFSLLWLYLHIRSTKLVLGYDGHYYFLNQNQFNWNQARTYCQTHCNSELASIHDETQNIMAMDIITNNEELQVNDSNNIWIGLYDPTTSDTIKQRQWSDGTSYDYATNTTQYPWQSVGSSNSGDCDKISMEQDFVWKDDICNTEYTSLCNSCDSKFHKYVAVRLNAQWDTHINSCNQYYGTDWASIHSQEDFDEAVRTAYLYQNNVFLGLTDKNSEGTWEWMDGTSFDWLSDVAQGEYPWFAGEPNNGFLFSEDCVEIMFDLEINAPLNDAFCARDDTLNYALCNVPSELCYEHYWDEVVVDTAYISWSECELNMDSTNGDSLLVMMDNEWVNHENTLRIHYMLSVESGINGDSGVVIDYIDETSYYYAGVSVYDGVQLLFIGKMEDSDYNELSYTAISISQNTYYQMEVNVSYDNIFTISMNGYSSVYTDNTREQTIFSGNIGVKNSGLLINAKSLFVSGSKVSETVVMASDVVNNSTPTDTTYADTVYISTNVIRETRNSSNSDTKLLFLVIVVAVAVLIVLFLIIVIIALSLWIVRYWTEWKKNKRAMRDMPVTKMEMNESGVSNMGTVSDQGITNIDDGHRTQKAPGATDVQGTSYSEGVSLEGVEMEPIPYSKCVQCGAESKQNVEGVFLCILCKSFENSNADATPGVVYTTPGDV